VFSGSSSSDQEVATFSKDFKNRNGNRQSVSETLHCGNLCDLMWQVEGLTCGALHEAEKNILQTSPVLYFDAS